MLFDNLKRGKVSEREGYLCVFLSRLSKFSCIGTRTPNLWPYLAEHTTKLLHCISTSESGYLKSSHGCADTQVEAKSDDLGGAVRRGLYTTL
jgi:hypothetical protein